MKQILVSVVIPTTGRRSLYRAVDSVLAQIGVNVEVLVVVNKTDELPSFTDQRVKVIDSRSSPGQGPSRQLGIEQASGDVVALLDDDDFWEPEKCIEQIRDIEKLISIENGEWVSATGLTIHYAGGRRVRRPRIHCDPISIGAPEEYLFVRRSVKRLDRFIQSSSLMFPRRLAILCPFDTLPEIHTDWGWVIEVCRKIKCEVILAAGHRTHYDVSSPGISKANRYKQSIAWAERMLAGATPRVVGDFYATSSLPIPALAGDVNGALQVLKCAYSRGRPGTAATLLACRMFLLCLIRFVKNKRKTSVGNH